MKNVRNSLAVSFLINVLWKDKPCEVGTGSLFSLFFSSILFSFLSLDVGLKKQ